MSKNIKEYDFFGVRSIPFEFSASLCNRTMSEALFLSLENVEHLLPLLAPQYRQFHAYQEYYAEAASKRFVSLDTFIREYYNLNIPKLEKITGREPISSTEILYITEIKYPDGEFDTQKHVLTNINGIWKIDIKKSREYWD